MLRRLVKQKNCVVYGEGALSKPIACKCFARFRPKNFDVKEESENLTVWRSANCTIRPIRNACNL